MTQVFEQTAVLQPVPGRPRVGRVYTEILVRNHADEILAEAGAIQRDEVREVRLSQVLPDTGAQTLCLPEDVISQLGLPILRRVAVATATGVHDMNLHQDARLHILGRNGTVECLALPSGSDPLLGVIPMEQFGLEPDLVGQVLRVLPMTGRATYIRA